MINRGFFTIATGNEKYYMLASNLLKSYRLHNSEYPFAILCDRENEYTKDFDQVVILDNVKNSFLDKFRMLIDSPYQEGIFIEPDCLIYRDISCFFDMLAKESDLSSFGWNNGLLTTFFDSTERIIEKYGEDIKTTPLFCPGYFFVRKGTVCEKIYHEANSIAQWIIDNDITSDNPRLITRGTLIDDPIFFIAMKLNNCICVEKPSKGKCVYLPRVKKIEKVSLRKGILDVIQEKEYTECNLLHFTTRRCVEEGLYWHQCIALKMIYRQFPVFITRFFESMFFILIFQLLKKTKFAILHRLKKDNTHI